MLSPVLRPVERALYRARGVSESREQHWVSYVIAMLFFHVGGFLVLYALMPAQAVLPFNPAGQSVVAEDLAFNTAASFITNINWQNYGGESTMSYLVQMAGRQGVPQTLGPYVDATTLKGARRKAAWCNAMAK